MNFQTLSQLDSQHVMHTYGRFPLAVQSGKNATCQDFDGGSYIDFSSGIGVNALGFADGEWAAAVARQAATLQHTSNLYYTEPCVQLAKALCQRTGMDKVFFANSGAEANEAAIKAARKYSFLKYGPGRHRVVTLQNSFHGRTVTTLAATGQEVFHNYFFPFTEGFCYAPAGDLAGTLACLDENTCAVMVELVQGEGGVIPLEQAYVDGLVQYCHEKDILVIVDEVQTGMGRTGTLFCYEQFGFAPDIVTAAKGIGGGLPLSAVLFSQKTSGALGPGDHATTYGGNPVCCAGALVVMGRLDEAFLAQVRQKGDYFRKRLGAMPGVTGVAGRGLMMGVSLQAGLTPAQVAGACIPEGLMVITAKDKLRLLPPLTITQEEMDKGLDILEKVLQSLLAQKGEKAQ